MLWCTEKLEDEELKVLLHEDSCQAQPELAELLGVDHTIVLKHLKALGMIQMQGDWMLYKMKLRDAEWRLVTWEQLLQ